jgi:hypothetical protein
LTPFLVFLLFFPAFAQEPIPDYDNPYAPIIFDKEVYSWADKVRITIIAPSWNENTKGIDTIGNHEGRFIKISTGERSIEPYKLTETEPDSGIFRGEITLTGFLHDVNGDSKKDTNPRTSGNGPTDGFLEVMRDDKITLSFEFADGVVLTKSASISWNTGKIEFDSDHYFVESTARVKVTDQDMNLNPELVDTLVVEVSSDSDSAGVKVNAIETSNTSGIFEGSFTFSSNQESSGQRLYAVTGDSIYAKYKDATLPLPYNIQDTLDITSKSKLESNIPVLERVALSDVYLADRSGNPVQEIREDNSFQIVGTVHNNQNFKQSFVYIIQIKNEDDIAMEISWIQGQLSANQTLQVSQSWMPDSPGKYKVETYVWNSLKDTLPLAQNLVMPVSVQ